VSKFLPFVTDTSSPLAIFKALLQRSKGLKSVQVASIYTAVLRHGIEEVRKVAERVSQSESANSVFKAVAVHFSTQAPDKSLIDFVGYTTFFNRNVPKDLQDFYIKDYALLVTCLMKEEMSHTWNELEIPFDMTVLRESYENMEGEISGPFKISKEGERVGFHSIEQLAAFLTKLSNKKSGDVPVVFNPVRIAAEKELIKGYELHSSVYESNNCITPFDFIDGGNTNAS